MRTILSRVRLQHALVMAVAYCVAIPAFADEMERLIAGIAGDDEAMRAEARQLLPRYGMDAAPQLLALMTHEDARVWRAAKNVVADICHSVGTPGRIAERRDLADLLMSVTLGDGPHHARKHALRLLGITAPEGYRVGALEKLAHDETWREEVIGALVVMGTTRARKVLNDLLNVGTGAQRAEIIEALRLITPAPEAPVNTRLLKSDDPEIRVAAMRALAQTGNKKLSDAFMSVVRDTEGRLHVEAVDACLQLANALLGEGQRPKAARSLFQRILDTEKDEILRAGAEAGLKRIDG